MWRPPWGAPVASVVAVVLAVAPLASGTPALPTTRQTASRSAPTRGPSIASSFAAEAYNLPAGGGSRRDSATAAPRRPSAADRYWQVRPDGRPDMADDHGHDDEAEGRTTAPQSEYTPQQVGIGFAVALVGLFVVFGVPLALTL